MKNRIPLILLSLLVLACHQPKHASQMKNEFNNSIPTKTFNYFGTEIQDDFFGLEDDRSERTEKWVKDEQNLTEGYMKSISFRNDIKKRYTEIFNFEKVGAPSKYGEYFFTWKNSGLQAQAVCYVRKGITGKDEVFIDPNQQDKNGTTTFDLLGANDDHSLMAVAISKAGSDWSTIRLMDIESKSWLEDQLEWVKFSGAAWFGNGFFYSRYPTPKEGEELSGNNMNHTVYYHEIGTSQSSDKLVFEDPKNPSYYNNASLSEDKRYLFIYSAPGTDGYLVYYKDLANNGGNFGLLFGDIHFHSSVVEVDVDGKLLVLTDVNAPTYQLVKVDPLNPSKENWKTIIPAQKELLQGVSTCGGKLFLHYLDMANTRIEMCEYDGSKRIPLEMPDNTGTTDGFSGKRTDNICFYSFTSFTYPGVTYSFDIQSKTSTEFFKPVLKFNPEDYVSQQVLVPSRDGKTQIPLFIVYKIGLNRNGNNPCLLYGYGGFNISLTPSFSTSRMVLLEQGGVFALANLRGGGEFGEEWHQAGMKMNKQNVFNDFLDCAEYLKSEKYTSTSKLALEGGSNGGLLVGACITQDPYCCAVAFPAVGVMDMLRYQEFTVGKGWIPEYGSSAESKEMFNYLLGYSPYHNLKPGTHYPATLVMTADHDDRVVPAHSFKFAAKLQECQAGSAPCLIRIETSAGHGAGKSTEQIIEEQTDKWAFFFQNTGVKYQAPSEK